ncbi:MAG: hypothetical protein LBO71_01160 [Prevotellaceae bacterium]|nr:hypothetical protein [Prevotellaceae bacterium]
MPPLLGVAKIALIFELQKIQQIFFLPCSASAEFERERLQQQPLNNFVFFDLSGKIADFQWFIEMICSFPAVFSAACRACES